LSVLCVRERVKVCVCDRKLVCVREGDVCVREEVGCNTSRNIACSWFFFRTFYQYTLYDFDM